jgi:ABC-type sugar transport systems, permease components
MVRVKVRGIAIYRAILFLPQILSMIVVGIAWRWIYAPKAFQHTGLAVVLQGLVRPRLRGTELEFWRNSEEARTDRPSQQLRSLNGEWRLMRYFLLTHLCGISHRIWCTLSTICSDAA